MKKIILLFFTGFLFTSLTAQNTEEIENLINEGIQYHDDGQYQQAITLYNQALMLEPYNLSALAEKAYSLMEAGEYRESINCCRLAIEKHPGENLLRMVYSNYGNALDEMNKPDSAIIIYDEGMKMFPDSYLLHFNKGITLLRQEKYPDALSCFQKSVTLNPNHPGSHNGISIIMDEQGYRIPCLMASMRFLTLEPEGKRASDNLATIRKVLDSYMEVTGKKKVTVNVTPEMLTDTNECGQRLENCFSTVELMLAMDVALDIDKKYAKQTEVEKFTRKFQTLCTFLEMSVADNYGFFWEFYAPYFIVLNQKQYSETFSYIAFASTGETYVWDWLNAHTDEINAFFEWSDGYAWEGE